MLNFQSGESRASKPASEHIVVYSLFFNLGVTLDSERPEFESMTSLLASYVSEHFFLNGSEPWGIIICKMAVTASLLH